MFAFLFLLCTAPTTCTERMFEANSLAICNRLRESVIRNNPKAQVSKCLPVDED